MLTMAKSDTEFARMAVSLKHLTQEQAVEGLRLLAQTRKMGLNETLPDILVKKGYLNRAQVNAVVRAIKQPRLSHIGKYRLIARIGQGGMGTVYKAKQESLDKVVALKVLSPALARQRDYVERFIREAQASGQLNHPNIVLGIDAGEADGYYYFAMEFVDGESLKEVLLRDGKLPERRALEITAAVAAALEHAHEHNIVHRDIKPGNIFIARDGTPKLGDLGLAKEIRTDQSITQAGIPVGTPYYISPEQVRGQRDIDQRADIYALGAMLYHLVTGVVPYDGHTAAVVMTRHLNDPIPDPRKNTPGLSDAILTIIRRCMQKDRQQRYQNAAQLREDVEAALGGKPLPHASKPLPRAAAISRRRAEREARAAKQRRRLLIGGSIAAGVVVLAVVLALVLGGGGPKPAASVPKPPTKPPAKQPKARVPRAKPPRRKLSTASPVLPKVKAAAVLRELIAFAAAADDREDVEKKFQEFILGRAGTKAAAKAKVHLAGLKARWKAEDDFRAAINEHIRNHRFAEAAAALEKPPFKEKPEKIRELLDDLASQVERAAVSYIASATAKGEELIRQGDLAAAKELYERLAKLARPEATKASRAALKKIEALQAARRKRLAQGVFAGLMVECAQLVSQGELAEAHQLFNPAQAKDNEDLAKLLKAAQGDLDRIEELFDQVERELASRARNRGSAHIKGILRPITRVEDHVVYCTVGTRTTQFPIHELRAADIRGLECAKDDALIPLLELYRGNYPGLGAALKKLGRAPGDPDVARWLQQLEWVEAVGREDQAKQALAKARKLADEKKWKEADALVSRLTDRYTDTAFVAEHGAEIGELAARCAKAVAARERRDETIKPFIDASDRCGDLTRAFKTYKPVGGWVMDIDNDGKLDIAFDIRHGGGPPYVPVFRNETKAGSTKIVFRDITREAGINTGDEPICFADLDGDGDLDIVCRGLRGPAEKGAWAKDHTKLATYENRGKGAPLFRLDPRRALSPALAKEPGYGGFGFGNIAVLDANGDGRADILAQYVCGKARTLSLFLAVPKKPFAFLDASRRAGFFRGKGDQVTTPEILQAKAWPNYVVFDCDGDQRADFIFNADNGLLFCSKGGRGFAPLANRSVSYQTYASGATGNNPVIVPAVADYDNDGDIDIFVPQKGRNLLLRNEGKGTFVDAMHTAGPMSTDEADSLWATWADVNNDGLLDLFICNAAERNRLYIQKANHAFVDKAEEFGVTGEKTEVTNFMAFGDLDRDGDIDMLILRDSGRSQLLLNPYVERDNRYYLSVLIRTRGGAIGAKVYLRRPADPAVRLQQVGRVEGYNRQTPREAFFGVPAAGEYRVRVVLSSGREFRRRVTIKPTGRNILVIP